MSKISNWVMVSKVDFYDCLHLQIDIRSKATLMDKLKLLYRLVKIILKQKT